MDDIGTREGFTAAVRELSRGNGVVDQIAWSMVEAHECESYAELFDALGENERVEFVEGLREFSQAFGSSTMRLRLK